MAIYKGNEDKLTKEIGDDYISTRDRLISRAKKFADKLVGSNPKGDVINAKWNRAFHSEMNRLYKDTL
jgi:hypothetical protein